MSSTRRTLLGRVMAALGGLAALEAGWVFASFLAPRRQADDETEAGLFVAGPVERFEPGSVTAFRDGHFYLARLEDGGFLALYRKCTHLGCTVPWVADQQRFACPCHASAFDIHGTVLSAPAPRPLDRFAVRIENGVVKVDTHKLIRRDAYHSEQAVRA